MQKIHDLPTPCLVLDLDRFEANLERMSVFTKEHGIHLRPHAKTHKCADIALRQMKEGAVGICVATIAEAEIMAARGVSGLLITSEMVGEPKVSRLMDVVCALPDTMVVIDDEQNATDLQNAAMRKGVTLSVLLDLDVGQKRTGVTSAEAARLADAIGNMKNLALKGICAYAGHTAHIASFDQRSLQSRRAMEQAVSTRDLLRRNGHNMEILSGSSTGTYNIDSHIPGVTELQAGSYVFMDVEYQRAGCEDFAPALCVLSSVIHRSNEKVIVDAGLKAFATDRTFGPELLEQGGIVYEFAGDEHGKLLIFDDSRPIRLGDKLRFIVPHCDPTVNLYDRIFCVRGEAVEGAWSIMDRGGGRTYF